MLHRYGRLQTCQNTALQTIIGCLLSIKQPPIADEELELPQKARVTLAQLLSVYCNIEDSTATYTESTLKYQLYNQRAKIPRMTLTNPLHAQRIPLIQHPSP